MSRLSAPAPLSEPPVEPSTLRPPPASDTASSIAESPFCVRVERGQELGLFRTVGTAPVTVGTASNSSFRLSDRHVSRFHCELFSRGEQCVIRDLGSTNGTYVDGVSIVEAVVLPGASIRLGETELRLELHSATSATSADVSAIFGEMVGRSPVMMHVFAALRSVANSSLTCLLLGETGTGKELAARGVHQHSGRASKPFLVVDCAAVGPQFIEDKLFGHLRGAFTGASSAVPGIFEEANGGTVFLDEIGELPMELQPKLLGVLERREAARIGSHTPVKLDVRLVVATHRNLSQMVQTGRFREDLLYRLAEFPLRIPSLRERPEDIELIAQTMLKREGFADRRLSADAVDVLRQMDWPGNIRELRNVLRRAAVLTSGLVINRNVLEQLHGTMVTAEICLSEEMARSLQNVSDRTVRTLPVRATSSIIPPPANLPAEDNAHFQLSLDDATESFRKAYVQYLRQRFGNDLTRAAAHAGIHPKSVSRLFRLYK